MRCRHMYEPCFDLPHDYNYMQAASAVRADLQALLEEFGKWSAPRTVRRKPCCLQHMLTTLLCSASEIHFFTMSYMQTFNNDAFPLWRLG